MDVVETLKIIPAAIIGLTVHEFAHALTAYRLGDNTAKMEGRISLNPIKHIDPLGFFLIILAGFGWAKPVRFNPDNLKHKHRDELLIAFAGPLSNLVVAVLMFVLAKVLYASTFFNSTQLGLDSLNLLITWGVINVGLFVFNALPIPPLDGSHLYLTFLKDTNPNLMMQLYKYGTWGLLALIIAESSLNINILHLSELIQLITAFCMQVIGF